MVLISFPEQTAYNQRIFKEWKPFLIFVILFYLLLSFLVSSFTFPLLICGFMLLVFYIETLKWTKVFIKEISYNAESKLVRIVYFEKDVLIEKQLELYKIK